MTGKPQHSGRWTGLWPVWVVLALVGIGLVGVVLTAPASGAVDYYNNSSGVVQSDAPENATLENILDLAVSYTPDLIGAGEQDPSTTGFQGVLLTGLVFAFASVSAMVGTSVGVTGGTILGLTVSYGLVDMGFAPPWMKVLLLFGLGVVVFVAIRKALQGR